MKFVLVEIQIKRVKSEIYWEESKFTKNFEYLKKLKKFLNELEEANKRVSEANHGQAIHR